MFQSKQRQELYDRIRQSSKQEVVLEEMIRLGFWPRQGTIPNDPADEIRRRGEVQGELDTLRTEQTRLKNTAAMLREIKKQRMAASRQRQQETRERRERERVERANAWRARQDGEIQYLGAGVSGGLGQRAGDDGRLQAQGLPVLQTPEAIAAAMGLKINTLRFLTFNRTVSKVSNYVRFEIRKKTGGMRRISAPRATLKFAQHWVLENVLSRVPSHDAAHGFLPSRSIVSNASPHVGAVVVINLDLQDFFPSITYRRAKGLFRALGYSEATATVFGLLCTEPQTEEVVMDGQTYYVAVGERRLPQGAPSSPAITNLICRRLDKGLAKVAADLGFTYTRYADDLSFSTRTKEPANVGRLLRRVTFILNKAGFQVNEKKTKVLRNSRRQEVTGVVVNEKLGVDRRRLRAFRAVLYQIEKDGPAGKTWGHSGNVLSAIWGYASFVAMVDPVRGAPLRERVKAILQKHGWAAPRFADRKPTLPATVPGRIVADRQAREAAELAARSQPPPAAPHQPPPPGSVSAPPRSPAPGQPKKPWWKFW